MPPGEDGQEGQPEHSQVNIQRRRSAANQERAHDVPARYRTDEQPEVPKVRRASLRLDESQLPPTTTSTKTVHPTSPETETNQRVRSSTSSRKAVRPSPTAGLPAIEQHETTEAEYRRVADDTNNYSSDPRRAERIMLARQRRRTVYEPPPHAHYRSQGKRRPQTLLGILQDISHNQTLMLIGSIVLVTLIILPILVNVIINALQPHTTIVPGTDTTTGSTQPSLNAPPVDPHELLIIPSDTDHPAPPVYATSAYLLDADTGVTLYAHNPFMHLPMMSTTKIMTAILAIEQGNLDRKVTIKDAIANDISQLSADSSLMGIKKGETYTVRDLLYGALLVSGNDAAIAIGDAVSGNLHDFVARMNQKATDMGLHDTHYMNPHGLLATGHYSSAHDLAIIGRYAMNLPDFRKISGTKEYTITQSAEHSSHFLINGNQFLWWYPGVDGGKPGWDGGTNFVQMISVTRNNHHLIGVTMHTNDWWTDMRNLMNWGFDNFTWISPYDVDIAHPPIPYDYDWNYFVKDKKTNTIPTVDQGRYYIYTGQSITGPIMNYFDKNGGLNKFGYPTGELTAASGTIISQPFEHGVLQCDTATNQCKTI
jgi:D-alanyl-D-alanine carboxypeptidase